MKVIDRAKAHFSEEGEIEIEVPEWGQEDKEGNNVPLMIYSGPVSLSDRAKCIENAGGENVKFFVYLLILKAKNKKGEKLFHPGDKADLMYRVDSSVVIRIGQEILRIKTPEEAEKNF